MKQQSFSKTNWKHRFSYGGTLRRQRAGRGMRPLSSKEPLHLVLKANSSVIRGGFRTSKRFFLIQHLIQKYAVKFRVKVEQFSIQGDHIHLLVRSRRRSEYQSFFQVLSGQIAQQMQKKKLLTDVTDTPRASIKATGNSGKAAKTAGQAGKGAGQAGEDVGKAGKDVGKATGLWLYRPFTRVIRGWRAYKTVRDYIQLNEKEALGEIPYRPSRLRGLLKSEWESLWGSGG